MPHTANHCLSKTLLAGAKDTNRALARENWQAVRARVRVRRSADDQAQSGVPVFLLDPRDTGCNFPDPACGHAEKADRPA